MEEQREAQRVECGDTEQLSEQLLVLRVLRVLTLTSFTFLCDLHLGHLPATTNIKYGQSGGGWVGLYRAEAWEIPLS